MTPDFTVFALLYGNYPDLAKRCVDSLLQLPPERAIIKLILNEVGDATLAYLRNVLVDNPRITEHDIIRHDVNRHKYPAMREAFYGEAGSLKVQTPYVMWFDDDSYLSFPKANEVSRWPENWLDAIENQLADGFDLMGAPYAIKISAPQVEWIKAQPWYRGRPISQPKMNFYTGGFWVAKMQSLAMLGYPWKMLDHNGGDVMLGAALQQARMRTQSIHGVMGPYCQKIAIINADDRGAESGAQRRGFSQKPIGYDYDPQAQAEDAQQGDTLNRATPAPPATLVTKKRVFRLDL